MSIRSLLRCGLTVSALTLLALGCGGSKGGALAPVTGKVNYRGKPLQTGTIVFSPDAVRGSSGTLSVAEIQPDGSYRLKSGDAVGAAPGCYRVTVAAVEDTAGAAGRAMPRSMIPAKYQDPEISGLSCEVKGGRDNTINFNLE
ncbi:MAG: hypothetical protein K2R98_30080 [Gemmataceae bacterium]|nr:hypothetical protein [Gemmataceae bacterium]